MLITIPVTLQYLGAESFGVWMTLSSFVALLAFTDFGLANGLMNAVAAASANQDSHQVRILVSTALAVLGTAALLLVAGYALFGSPLRWSEVLSTQSSDIGDSEISAARAAFAVCLALGMPAAIIQRVQMALQMGRRQSLAVACVCCGIDCHPHRSSSQRTACMACRGKLRYTDYCQQPELRCLLGMASAE